MKLGFNIIGDGFIFFQSLLNLTTVAHVRNNYLHSTIQKALVLIDSGSKNPYKLNLCTKITLLIHFVAVPSLTAKFGVEETEISKLFFGPLLD